MNFDLRLPLGITFTLFGLTLSGAGVWGPETWRQKSLGINMDLWWGLVLLAFGGWMLWLSRRQWRKGG